MGPSKKCWFWCNGPSTKAPQIPLRHQKTFHLALFLSNLAILQSAALFQGLNYPKKQKKANWRSQLHAQRSQMHSIPLGPSEKNSFCAKHKEGAICAILTEKPPFLASPEDKRGVVNCARLHKAGHWPNNNANPSGLSEKKSLLCRKAR